MPNNTHAEHEEDKEGNALVVCSRVGQREPLSCDAFGPCPHAVPHEHVGICVGCADCQLVKKDG